MTDTAERIRPLLFVRVRFRRGGQAEWARDIFRDEQDAMLADLAKARAKGLDEDSEEIAELREQLAWGIEILKDMESALVELAGPDRDPR